MCFYNNRLLAINLCRFALGGQTVKNLRLLASKFELDQSQRKSMQVDASGWPNETQGEGKSKTCVDLRVRLVCHCRRLLSITRLRFVDEWVEVMREWMMWSIPVHCTTSVKITVFSRGKNVKMLLGICPNWFTFVWCVMWHNRHRLPVFHVKNVTFKAFYVKERSVALLFWAW